MMRAVACLVLLLVVCGMAQAYPTLYEYGAGYTYQSRADDYGYVWSLRNESLVQPLTAWTWSGGTVGDLPGAVCTEAVFPLPLDTWDARPWYNIVLDGNTSVPLTVDSTITWADGSTAVVPVYMPSSAVPEPAGLLVLGVGIVPLLRRRR